MMKQLFAFVAVTFSSIAMAQNPALVGLPQYRVTLGGTIDNPSILNNSGKSIIGYVMHFENAQGLGSWWRTLMTRSMRNGIDSAIPSVALEHRRSRKMRTKGSGGPTVQVSLDAVAFNDGEVVGPDSTHAFEAWTLKRNTEVALAEQVSAARRDPSKRDDLWAELKQLADPDKVRIQDPDDGMLLADDLLSARRKGGDNAAYDMADRVKSLPKLWRTKR